MAKYSVDYVSGATGYGWTQDFETIAEVDSFVNQMRSECSAGVRVWDRGLGDFVFWKDAYVFDPRIDMLRSPRRDMRTKTRTVKSEEANA